MMHLKNDLQVVVVIGGQILIDSDFVVSNLQQKFANITNKNNKEIN